MQQTLPHEEEVCVAASVSCQPASKEYILNGYQWSDLVTVEL